MRIILGFVLALSVSGIACAGIRDDTAALSNETAAAISNYMAAWADVKPVNCRAGADMGERLAHDMVGAVQQLSDELTDPLLDATHQFVMRESLAGVAPYAAQGQLYLADGYTKARCFAKARQAYQVVLDTFTTDGDEVYRKHAQSSLQQLPPE